MVGYLGYLSCHQTRTMCSSFRGHSSDLPARNRQAAAISWKCVWSFLTQFYANTAVHSRISFHHIPIPKKNNNKRNKHPKGFCDLPQIPKSNKTNPVVKIFEGVEIIEAVHMNHRRTHTQLRSETSSKCW